MLTRICIVLALLAHAPACHPQTPPTVETVEYVNTAAQAKLEDAMRLVLGAEAKVEFICEAFPQSRSCTFLSATISKFYAVAVFVQDALDAGANVDGEVESLLRVATAVAGAADKAYRSLS